METPCRRKQTQCAIISCRVSDTLQDMMDPIFDIPKTHSPRRARKIIAMLAVAVLLFTLAANPLVDIAAGIAAG